MRDSVQRLRDRGLRVTAQRLAVLDAVAAHPHSAAGAVAHQVNANGGAALSRQGLYNVLDDLERVQLLRRIQPAFSPARYEIRTEDNHHHMVCRDCGAVADIDCAIGAAPCLQPVDTAGFVLDEAEVLWWGTCVDCALANAQPVATPIRTSRSEPPAYPTKEIS